MRRLTDEEEDAVNDAILTQFIEELNTSLEGKTCKLQMPAKIAFTLTTYAIVEMRRVEEIVGSKDTAMRECFTYLADFFGVSYGIEARLMIQELLKGNVKTTL